MIKTKLIKSVIIGTCIAVNSIGFAYADIDDTALKTSQVQIVNYENGLEQKQKEIDLSLFEQHRGELEKKGIFVTHTAPMSKYIEIGITPYSAENADYIYSIVGKEEVKVVEGQQAVTLELGPEAYQMQPIDISEGQQAVTMELASDISAQSAQPERDSVPKFVTVLQNMWDWVKSLF